MSATMHNCQKVIHGSRAMLKAQKKVRKKIIFNGLHSGTEHIATRCYFPNLHNQQVDNPWLCLSIIRL